MLIQFRAEIAEKRLKNERIEELEKLLAQKEQQISELGASQPEPVPEPQKVELTDEEVAGKIFIFLKVKFRTQLLKI